MIKKEYFLHISPYCMISQSHANIMSLSCSLHVSLMKNALVVLFCFFIIKKKKKKESYQGSYLWFKVKCANTFLRNICCSLIAKSSPTLCDPVDCSCPQAPLSMGSPSQEYWTGLLFLCPGDLLDPGIKLASPALAGSFFSTVPPRKPEKQ